MIERRLFFDHIPKTAGTSFWKFLAESFGTDNTSPQIKGMKLDSALSLYKEKLVISGHFSFILGDRLPHGYISATVLRDPRERTLSDYFFIVEDMPFSGLSSEEIEIKSNSAEDVFFNPKLSCRFANAQACHLASFFHAGPLSLPPSELLTLAKRGLDQYDLVGTTEHLSEFVDYLKKLYEFPHDLSLKRLNVTSRRKIFGELDPTLRKRIEEINLVDLELWHYADTLLTTKTVKFVMPVRDSIEEAAPEEVKSLVNSIESHIGDGSIELLNVNLTGQATNGCDFLAGELLTLSISIRALKDIDELNLGYSIHHDSGLHVFGVNTQLLGYKINCRTGEEYKADFTFPVLLGLGNYYVNIAARSGLSELDHLCMSMEKVALFNVAGFLDIVFEGMTRLIPSCLIGIIGDSESVEVQNSISLESGFKRLNIFTPEVTDARGSLSPMVGVLPSIRPGEQFSVQLEIYNASGMDWVGEGHRPVYLSYHWRNANGEMLTWEGFRTPLPSRIVKSGGKTRASAMVEAPMKNGQFGLELTLVQEQVCWFEERGFATSLLEANINEAGS